MSAPEAGFARRRLLSVLVAAAAYYVAGRLGLLLAIPPGYATAVWPASGIALAMVLLRGYAIWPGILIGSFLVNVGTSFDAGSIHGIAKSLALALSIAGGASLEAVAGTWLIRKLVGYSNILTMDLDVVRILVLGGPASCLVNATVGVTSLWCAGLIPTPNFLFNWWTWWIGDSIGVIIFTPLILVWTLRPWQQWLRRQIAVTIPLTIMFALVVLLFFFTSNREQENVRIEFAKEVAGFSAGLDGNLERMQGLLEAMSGFYASSQSVERDEFHTFTEKLLNKQVNVLALSWNPRVQEGDRAAFESSVRRDGFADFSIFTLDAHGRRLPAATAANYYPILFIEPSRGNERAFGFDTGVDSGRVLALNRARDTGQPSATELLRLVQLDFGRPGMLIYMPVYKNGLPHDTLEERRLNLRGFVAVAFQMEVMLEDAMNAVRASGLLVRVYDVTTQQSPTLLFSSSDPHQAIKTKGGLQSSDLIDVGGRRWRLEFYLTPDYLVAHRSWQAWSMLATGLLFTGLLGMFLLVVIGRATRIEALVAQRTAELQQVNKNLNVEVQERKRLEQEAQSKATELSQKNEELEQFAYVASHDLQAPLRGVSGFAQLLQREYAEKLGKEGSEFIDFIINGTGQMHRLIGDLLQLSRIQTRAGGMSATDSNEVVRQALESMKLDISDAKAEIVCQKLPVVWGDHGQLLQLFQNLVGNAIKFQKEGARAHVEISAFPEQEHWHFRIADNGIGIPADQIQRLFIIFSRLHTTEAYPGTGIGLAICKKIVERHFGKIWVESVPGSGTTFHFTLPATQ